MNRQIKYILLSLLFILLQTTVVQLFSLNGIVCDMLLIWVVYISIQEGQMSGTIYGFSIGLVFDMVSGGFLGLSSLTKALCGFSAGYFYNENKIEITLGSYRFLLVVLFSSILHNFIYFLLYQQGSEINIWLAVLKIGLTTTLYTTTVSIIPVLIYARKYSFKT
jgi:rod shape-determining protein MreD